VRDISKRLEALEREHEIGPCDCQKDARVVHRILDLGEPPPPCPKCGRELYCIAIEEVIVDSHDEAMRRLREVEEEVRG
jgi:hypothetical protein